MMALKRDGSHLFPSSSLLQLHDSFSAHLVYRQKAWRVFHIQILIINVAALLLPDIQTTGFRSLITVPQEIYFTGCPA